MSKEEGFVECLGEGCPLCELFENAEPRKKEMDE